jgi:cysteine desulfurase
MHYFDFAATTPMTPAALKTYQQTAQQFFGNPNSPHPVGEQAAALLAHCRQQLALQLTVPAESLIFTSGGTEANHLAIALTLQQLPPNRREILISPLEHSSFAHELAAYPHLTVKTLPLDHGQVTPAILTQALTPATGLVIIQQVHSITGLIQPITPLAQLARANGSYFHCDCVQSFGKVPLPQQVTSWSCAGHKFGGPKSCGLLYLDPTMPFTPLLPNVSQEHGFRPGTVDVPGIASFTTAALASLTQQSEQQVQFQHLKQQLQQALPQWQPAVTNMTYPGIIGLLAPHTLGTVVLAALSAQEICIATTSACNSQGEVDPSLLALGFTKEQAQHFIRISLGPTTTPTEIQQLAQALQPF